MRRWLVTFACVPFLVSACGGGGTTPTTPTPPCVMTADNVNISIGFAAGNGVVTVSAPCNWTAASNTPNLTITSGATGNGAGTVAFTVSENTTGQLRIAIITLTPAGGTPVQVTVTQAVAPPPITWTLPAIANAVTGQFYQQSIATAQGGTGTFHYQLDTFGGFPPIGLILAPNGIISGTANIIGPATFRVCAVDTTQRQFCQAMTINVVAATATGSAIIGNWSGNIVLNVGCLSPLPANFPWSGSFRTSPSGGGTELVVTVPRAFVFNEVHPVTITGQQLRFTVDFDSLYTFVATFSADFRSLSGTFTGGNCNLPSNPVLPSGTWNGTKQ